MGSGACPASSNCSGACSASSNCPGPCSTSSSCPVTSRANDCSAHSCLVSSYSSSSSNTCLTDNRWITVNYRSVKHTSDNRNLMKRNRRGTTRQKITTCLFEECLRLEFDSAVHLLF